MYGTWFVFLVCLQLCRTQGLQNLLNTPEHQCIRCLCHAVSGCYSLKNCSKYSVNFDYWLASGGPTLIQGQAKNQETYQQCLTDNNCILNTINAYTSRLGDMDCNCDGTFNCEDRFAIHFDKCNDPTSIRMYLLRKRLYKKCSGSPMTSPGGGCIPEVV